MRDGSSQWALTSGSVRRAVGAVGRSPLIEQLGAATNAALRGDDEGLRLVVSLLPASQLREAVEHLAHLYASTLLVISGGRGSGDMADNVARWIAAQQDEGRAEEG